MTERERVKMIQNYHAEHVEMLFDDICFNIQEVQGESGKEQGKLLAVATVFDWALVLTVNPSITVITELRDPQIVFLFNHLSGLCHVPSPP